MPQQPEPPTPSPRDPVAQKIAALVAAYHPPLVERVISKLRRIIAEEIGEPKEAITNAHLFALMKWAPDAFFLRFRGFTKKTLAALRVEIAQHEEAEKRDRKGSTKTPGS